VENTVDVKSAINIAKEWVRDVLKDEEPANVGLEEVEHDDQQGVWKITIGFSRPWNTARNPLTAITGEPIARRAYRIVTIKEPHGEVISMKRREGAPE
jgi:hypothetical protein